MCAVMEELRIESEKKGAEKKAKESALNMYKDGLPVEKIALYLNCAVESVRKWLDLQPTY